VFFAVMRVAADRFNCTFVRKTTSSLSHAAKGRQPFFFTQHKSLVSIVTREFMTCRVSWFQDATIITLLIAEVLKTRADAPYSGSVSEHHEMIYVSTAWV